MSLTFGIGLPQGWTMELASIHDPVEAYEAMTGVARHADELGFASIWLVDHFDTIPHPSQEKTFAPCAAIHIRPYQAYADPKSLREAACFSGSASPRSHFQLTTHRNYSFAGSQL